MNVIVYAIILISCRPTGSPLDDDDARLLSSCTILYIIVLAKGEDLRALVNYTCYTTISHDIYIEIGSRASDICLCESTCVISLC